MPSSRTEAFFPCLQLMPQSELPFAFWRGQCNFFSLFGPQRHLHPMTARWPVGTTAAKGLQLALLMSLIAFSSQFQVMTARFATTGFPCSSPLSAPPLSRLCLWHYDRSRFNVGGFSGPNDSRQQHGMSLGLRMCGGTERLNSFLDDLLCQVQAEVCTNRCLARGSYVRTDMARTNSYRRGQCRHNFSTLPSSVTVSSASGSRSSCIMTAS